MEDGAPPPRRSRRQSLRIRRPADNDLLSRRVDEIAEVMGCCRHEIAALKLRRDPEGSDIDVVEGVEGNGAGDEATGKPQGEVTTANEAGEALMEDVGSNASGKNNKKRRRKRIRRKDKRA